MKRLILTIIAIAAMFAASAQRVGGAPQAARTQPSRQPAQSVSRQPSQSRPQSTAQYQRAQPTSSRQGSVYRTQQPRPSESVQPSTRRPPQGHAARPATQPSRTVTVTRRPDGTVTRTETRAPGQTSAQPRPSDSRSDTPNGFRAPEKQNGAQAQPAQDKRGPGTPHGGPGGPGHWNGHAGGPSFGHVHPVPHGYHPRPPMHHPMHHRPIHMRYCIGIDWIYREIIWMNYWNYLHTHSWMDRTAVIVGVNSYTPANVLVDYIVSDSMVFSIYRDTWTGETYFAVTDEYDRTVARVKIGRKYHKLMVDEYGVWVLDRRGNDPIYFMLIDGQIYMYDCN